MSLAREGLKEMSAVRDRRIRADLFDTHLVRLEKN